MYLVSVDEDLKLAFNWRNTQTLLKEVHSQRSGKFGFFNYHLQFFKTYQFLKLNEEGIN